MHNIKIFNDHTIVPKAEVFAQLPYLHPPYSKKNWGHRLHELCSYPSKIRPPIAYHLVKVFTSPGDTVFDPFCGVGTIPFESCLQGRRGLANDINPIAYHVSNAKIHKINKTSVNEIIRELQIIINRQCNKKLIEINIEDEYIYDFFHEDTFNELYIIRDFFLSLEKWTPEYSFVLSCILHILHGNRPYALSRRSHNVIPIPPKGEFVYKSTIQHIHNKSRRMFSMNYPLKFVNGLAFQNNIIKDSFENITCDHIITSPPFLTSTEFLRQNRVRLWFLGWDSTRLKSERTNFIEYQDIEIYRIIFNKFYTILSDNGVVVLHLGVVKQTDMADVLIPFAEEEGFLPIASVYEDTSNIPNHGRTDRGATHKHVFLIMKKK